MATKNDVLKALSEQKDQAGQLTTIMTGALAKKVGTTEGSLRSQLSSLKRDGYVEGSSTEGWIITQEGIASVERGDEIPFSAKDAGKDLPSRFKYYGQLHGVSNEIILATLDIAQSRDLENLESVWDAMTEMGVELTARRRWFASWRNYLKQGMPPSLKEKVEGTKGEAPEEGTGEISVLARDKGRDYIIVDDLPVRVGPGLGDYTMQDAKDLINIRAIKARFAGGGGGASPQWGPQQLAELFNLIQEKRGGEANTKIYALEQGEQGTVLREVKPGEPLNLNPPGAGKPQPMLIIDSEGVVQEMKPGLRIGTRSTSNNQQPPKITVVRQTKDGIVKETHDAGDVIILADSSQGSSGGSGLPFPVFDSDGKPLVDNLGRPVYANLESTLKVLGWRDEQRRANERHDALMGLVQAVKENVGDGIAALREAAAEIKGGSKTQAPAEQIYECGNCHAQFKVPTGDWQTVLCPNCKTQYTREQVLGK